MLKFWRKLKLWYITNRVPHVVLCAATEQCYISKALWKRIIRDLKEPPRELHVFFEKYPLDICVANKHLLIPYLYRFFVNSDLSGVRTPDGDIPFTAQIQVSPFGHVGFQSVQPTPIEILTEYGFADADFINYHLPDHVRLRVTFDRVNGEPCYVIQPVKLGDSFRPFGEPEPDDADMVDLTDINDE